jgi:hypothetical protein
LEQIEGKEQIDIAMEDSLLKNEETVMKEAEG